MRDTKCSYRKRTFLMPASSGIPSYVLAEVESSSGGKYKSLDSNVTVADCHRQITLEFPLGTARDRRNSLAKIDLLVKVLIAFGTALQGEAESIVKAHQQRRKSSPKKVR